MLDDDQPAEPYGRHDDPSETEVLETSDLGPPGKGRSRVRLLGAAGAAVLVLIAGGAVYAYNLLSGGGAQPEEYVPADAIAFVKVDLDPAAGQKLAAREFFGHFPGAADALEDDDIRKILFELAQEDNESLASLDYDEDIKPWLGERVGIAVLPLLGGMTDPPAIAVLQVRNQELARQGLREISEATDADPPAVVFAGGYALIAENELIAERARDAAAEASLADDERFQADLKPFDEGVGAFWVDLEGTGEAISELGPTAESPSLGNLFDDLSTGRVAGVLSFDGNYAEFTIRVIDASGFGVPSASAEPVGPLFETLPHDTLVAVALSGFDEAMAEIWDSVVGVLEAEPGGETIEAEIAQLEAEFGLRLPDDLVTLIGHQTVVALAGDSVVAQPTIGYRAETDGAAAEEVLRRVEDVLGEMGVPLPLVWDVDGSTLLIGASLADLSAMQSGTGIADPAAATALPNLDEAVQAFWVDLDGFSEILEAETPDPGDLEIMHHIAGIGATTTVTSDGNWTSTIRVVAD